MHKEIIQIHGVNYAVQTHLRQGTEFYYRDGLYLEAVETSREGYRFYHRFLRLDETTDVQASFDAVVHWIQWKDSVVSDIRLTRIQTVE